MPKIVDKEAMQDKIRASAIRAFVRDGYHATTIDNVAKEAGIAKGTVYLYFESKDELAHSIADRHLDSMEERFIPETMASTKKDFLAQIEAALDAEDEFADFIPVFFEIFGPSFRDADFQKRLTSAYDKFAKYYTKQIQHLQTKKQLPKSIDAKQMGATLVSLIDGIVMHRGILSVSKRKFRPRVTEVLQLIEASLGK